MPAGNEAEVQALAAKFVIPQTSRRDGRTRKTQRILDNNVTNKSIAAEVVATAEFGHGAPGTIKSMRQARDCFLAWRTDDNGEIDESLPTEEQLLNFLICLVIETKPRDDGKPAANQSSVLQQWNYVLEYCHWKWKHFGQHVDMQFLRARAGNLLAQQTAAGNLLKGTWRQRSWVGLAVLHYICSTFLKQCIQYGYASWDIVVAQLLIMTWISACCGRAGDLALSYGYDDINSLRFSDIILTLEGGTTLEHLHAEVTLRYTKGYKDDGSKNKVVSFRWLPNDQYAVICPLRWLVVHSLRHNLFRGAEGADPEVFVGIDEVLRLAAARGDKTLRWRFPDYPVLCNLKGRFCSLNQPLKSARLTMIVAKLGQLTGLTERITGHSFRRGFTKAATTISAKVGGNLEAARVNAGHSHHSFHAGTTAKYIGHHEVDIFNQIVEARAEVRNKPSILTSLPPLHHGKVSPSEITAFAQDHRLDVSSKAGRQKAARKLMKSELKRYQNATDSTRIAPPDASFQPPVPPAFPRPRTPQAPASPTKSPAAVADELQSENSDIESDDNITQGEIITSTLLGTEGADIDFGLAGLALTMDLRMDIEAGQSEQISSIDFINLYASVNIYRNSGRVSAYNKEAVAKYIPSGNSRNEPFPFIHACSCGSQFWSRREFQSHLQWHSDHSDATLNGGLLNKNAPSPFTDRNNSARNSALITSFGKPNPRSLNDQLMDAKSRLAAVDDQLRSPKNQAKRLLRELREARKAHVQAVTEIETRIKRCDEVGATAEQVEFEARHTARVQAWLEDKRQEEVSGSIKRKHGAGEEVATAVEKRRIKKSTPADSGNALPAISQIPTPAMEKPRTTLSTSAAVNDAQPAVPLHQNPTVEPMTNPSHDFQRLQSMFPKMPARTIETNLLKYKTFDGVMAEVQRRMKKQPEPRAS